MKVAAVDALKKCCSTFGIGLHLYDGDSDQANRASNNGQHNGDPFDQDWHDYGADFNGAPPREQGPERYDIGNDPSPATSKQIVALQNIAKSSKTDPDLKDEINRKLKTPTTDGSPRVTKKEASDLISRAFDND